MDDQDRKGYLSACRDCYPCCYSLPTYLPWISLQGASGKINVSMDYLPSFSISIYLVVNELFKLTSLMGSRRGERFGSR